jgi:hypothetical protein
VILAYGLWLAGLAITGHDPRVFIALERKAIFQGHGSQVIRYDKTFPYNGPGYEYDGGYFYLIALDPVHAGSYLDAPSARYSKILYPMTARVLALGRSDLIPYTLILINWLTLGLGTLFLAAWLKRHNIFPGLALLYSFYFGTFIGIQRDLTEPMSYSLVLAAIYLYDLGGRKRLLGSSACFALAILTRDKAAVFAILYGLAILLARTDAPGRIARVARNGPAAALFLAIAGLPMLVYKVFLHSWLGAAAGPLNGQAVPLNEQAAPLQGILAAHIPMNALLVESISVFLPTLIVTGLALWALKRRIWRLEIAVLLVMIELTVVTLNPAYFVEMRGVTRVGIAIVIGTLLCLPVFDRLTQGNRRWLVVCGVCWTSITIVEATAGLFLARS